jgi:hypothetical protein
MLSYHPRLSLRSAFYPWEFPTKLLCTFPVSATCHHPFCLHGLSICYCRSSTCSFLYYEYKINPSNAISNLWHRILVTSRKQEASLYKTLQSLSNKPLALKTGSLIHSCAIQRPSYSTPVLTASWLQHKTILHPFSAYCFVSVLWAGVNFV